MSSSGINFSGLGSGIDTESIITQYLTIEKRPISILQNQQVKLRERQTAYSLVSAQMLSLQFTTQNLDRLRAFDLVSAASSDETAFTVTAQTGAQTGVNEIGVTRLAKAQLLSSVELSSKTDALGFSGQFVLNGKTVTMRATDTLETLASNINSANTGVTASIISPSPGKFRLTLGSSSTGVQGSISLSDTGSNNFLGGTLGLFGAGQNLRNPVNATTAGSALFKDSATSVGTLLGMSAPASGTVSITSGGTTQTVAINLGTDSISAIAANINTAFGSTVARVVDVTDPATNATRRQLQLSGISGSSDLTDANNVLANLGLVQRTAATGSELVAARDAEFTINGLPARRPTNTITDAISGVSFTLLKEGTTASLTVSQDYDSIKSNVKTFVEAFNRVIDTIANVSSYDPQTNKTGVLFGDSAVSSIVDNLVSQVSGSFSGLPRDMSVLAQAGITLDTRNHLVLNESTLTSALRSNLAGVGKLFRAAGDASNPQVQFVSTTKDTQPSGSAGYAVFISRAAEQASVTAGADFQTLTGDETLTFGGALFNTSPTGSPLAGKSILLRAGTSLDDAISQINADTSVNLLVTASRDGNKIKFSSKQYGSKAGFAVASAVPSGAGTSGIGTTTLADTGVDVAGSINGEAATGDGQFLTGSMQGTGSASRGRALGLQLRISGTTTGSYGTIMVTQGAANLVRNYVDTQSDVRTGGLSTSADDMQRGIDDLDDTITDLQDRLKERELNLRTRFLAMESSLSRIKAASAGVSQLAAMSTNKSK